MLSTPTIFPHQGSYALLPDRREPGGFHLVRLVQAVPETGGALVAFPLRPGSSGNRRVQLAELVEGRDLNPAEEADLIALNRDGYRTEEERKRCEALRTRRRHAEIMARLRDRLARIEHNRLAEQQGQAA